MIPAAYKKALAHTRKVLTLARMLKRLPNKQLPCLLLPLKRPRRVILAVGFGLIGSGLFLLSPWFLPQSGHANQGPSQAEAFGQPRYINLPTLKAGGNIQPVGLDNHRRIAAPTDIAKAGWYTGSAKPGENGLSIIDGHLSGEYKHGVFNRLKKIRIGDTFNIEYGEAKTYTFRVEAVHTVTAEEANAALFARDANIPSQLNLITCNGSFQDDSQQFDQRLIVIARAVDM